MGSNPTLSATLHAVSESDPVLASTKLALDWVIERQCVKVDKASDIVNDANA